MDKKGKSTKKFKNKHDRSTKNLEKKHDKIPTDISHLEKGKKTGKKEAKPSDHISSEEEEAKHADHESGADEGEIQQEDKNERPEADEEEERIKIFMIDFKQCDSKKCTGRKLERLGKLKTISHKVKFRGIVLSAFATKIASKEDKDILVKSGICVIDCSWNKIESLNIKTTFENERKLPFMVAVNPVNYGAAFKLSCAEAVAATLFISGFENQALELMEKFKWGPSFFVVNQDVFLRYSGCQNSAEIDEQQKLYLKEEEENHAEYLKQKQLVGRNYDLPSSSSSDDDHNPELNKFTSTEPLQQTRNLDLPESSSEEDNN